jgi:ribosome-associated protein
MTPDEPLTGPEFDQDQVQDQNQGAQTSKTARKREAERLQSLGLRLTELKPAQIAQLDLSERLRSAIADYQRFASREAKRRQLQFIGRVMRGEDIAAVEQTIAGWDGESAEARHEFHQLELWRERLIHEPDALTEFIASFPQVDRQQLRQLINKARAAKTEEQQKKFARSLFRFIREI